MLPNMVVDLLKGFPTSSALRLALGPCPFKDAALRYASRSGEFHQELGKFRLCSCVELIQAPPLDTVRGRYHGTVELPDHSTAGPYASDTGRYLVPTRPRRIHIVGYGRQQEKIGPLASGPSPQLSQMGSSSRSQPQAS